MAEVVEVAVVGSSRTGSVSSSWFCRCCICYTLRTFLSAVGVVVEVFVTDAIIKHFVYGVIIVVAVEASIAVVVAFKINDKSDSTFILRCAKKQFPD